MKNKLILSSLIIVLNLQANSLEQIQQSKTIRIAVMKNLPPFSQKIGNTFDGFEVKLARKIANKILPNDANITFIGIEAKDRINVLKNNEADMVVANFAKSEKNSGIIGFSIPYLSSSLAVLSSKDSKIQDIEEFKKIAYVEGSHAFDFLEKKGIDRSKLISCENTRDCFLKLINKQADAYIDTNLLLAKYPVVDKKTKITIEIPQTSSYICVGVDAKNKMLLKEINDEILELSKSEFFKKSYENTFKKFFKNSLDKKYFLLDDLYKMMF